MITVGSLFTQALSLVNRNAFGRAVRQWDAEHGAKGFRCWDQFVAMVFCQLAGALAAQQQRRFRFKNPLFSIDSSTIDLCLSLYDWA
jgi:hypothetical protein